LERGGDGDKSIFDQRKVGTNMGVGSREQGGVALSGFSYMVQIQHIET